LTDSPTTTPTRLFAALFDAQRTVKPVPKADEMDAGKFGYMYASAADVVRYARAHLHEHGLALFINSTACRQIDHRGVVALAGVVFHPESGETWPVVFELPYVGTKGRPDDKASQASITTGEARAYRLLLGLTTEDAEDEVANRRDDVADRTPPAAEPPPAPPTPPKESTPPKEPKPAPPPAAPAAKADPPKPAAQTPTAEVAGRPAEWGTPATPEEIAAFDALIARLGLDRDTAVTWASRTPFRRPNGDLSRMRDELDHRIYSFGDAAERGMLPELTGLLEEEIADLKRRSIHPRKSGWADKVKKYSADLIGF